MTVTAIEGSVGHRIFPEFLKRLEGIGWEGNLDEMRRSKVEDVE